jgi:glycosyltransferase involved in cell wall biosynthesis
MKKSPLISIVIPTLNSHDVIHASIESIAAQGFRSIEVILSDGGSHDQTVQYAMARLQKAAIDVSIIISPGSSIYHAINLAVSIARGEWLYVLGSDDRLYNADVLHVVAQHLISTSADVVYGDAWFERSPGFLYGGIFWLNRFNVLNVCHQSVFYRSSAVRKLGITYDEDYKILADWDYNLRLFARLRFEHISLPIARYACYGISDSKKDDAFLDGLPGKIIDYFGVRAFWLMTPDWLSIAVAQRSNVLTRVLLAANRLTYVIGRKLIGSKFGQRAASTRDLYVSPLIVSRNP